MPSDLELLDELLAKFQWHEPSESPRAVEIVSQLRSRLAEPKVLTEEELAQLIYKHNPELLRPEANSLASLLMPFITSRADQETAEWYEVLEGALESLRRAGHTECNDPWYSCPKHPECCNTQWEEVALEKRPCYCGVDATNAIIDKALLATHSQAEATHDPK